MKYIIDKSKLYPSWTLPKLTKKEILEAFDNNPGLFEQIINELKNRKDGKSTIS